MIPKSVAPKLIISASVSDADMFYATKFFVPDPFIYLEKKGKKHVVMSELEIDRARKSMRDFTIWSWNNLAEKISKKGSPHRPGIAEIAIKLCKINRVSKVVVPGNFPLEHARELEKSGIVVTPVRGSIFPERDLKSPSEIKAIREALRITQAGISSGKEALRRSKVAKNGQLKLDGTPLTAERLRAIIDSKILEFGGIAQDTIVACGNQGCDPHERGHGPLKAKLPIIVDVFPRISKTGYHGDITRTFVKGRPKDIVFKIYDAVHAAQTNSIAAISHDVATTVPHQVVCETFENLGFKTGKHPKTGVNQGFFHGTGHGLGLEIHEMPRMGKNSSGLLLATQVVTVEPGLYYPGIGGVRLEDVVVVTKRKPRNLVDIEKDLMV